MAAAQHPATATTGRLPVTRRVYRRIKSHSDPFAYAWSHWLLPAYMYIAVLAASTDPHRASLINVDIPRFFAPRTRDYTVVSAYRTPSVPE